MLNEVKSEWGTVTLPSTGPQSYCKEGYTDGRHDANYTLSMSLSWISLKKWPKLPIQRYNYHPIKQIHCVHITMFLYRTQRLVGHPRGDHGVKILSPELLGKLQ